MRVWPLLVVGLLGGCTQFSPRSPLEDAQIGPAWRTHVADVQAAAHWSVTGRLGIKTADDGWSAGLHWVQDLEDYRIRVSAPLGQGTVELQGGSGQVTLRAPRNRVWTAADPESLMHARLGWALPLTGLRYWIRGLPEPGSKIVSLRLDPWGRMAELRQSGWIILIDEYLRSGAVEMPSRLSITAPRLRLRLVANDWRLGPG